MADAARTSPLVDLPDSVLWTSRSSPDFAGTRAAARRLAVLPLFGFADWGLGRPLDLEETVGCGVLRAMLATDGAPARALTILPPLRFVLGPYPHTLFGLDYETALEVVGGIAAGVRAAGFQRLAFFNTSPWNEEFAESCAGDLRAETGLRTYVIHLEALGLDLHPVRSSSRSAVQAAACALTGRAPADDSPRADVRLPDFRPGDIRQPPPLAFMRSLDTSIREGWTVLADAGARLAALLAEIHATGPGARAGATAKPTRKAAPARRTRSRK